MRSATTFIAILLLLGACGGTAAAPQTSPRAMASAMAPATAAANSPKPSVTDTATAAVQLLASMPEEYWGIDTISAFKEAQAGGAYVIDVREPSEYAAGHIPGAVNIPLRTLASNLDKIPTDRPVIVHCRTSHRAGMATAALHLLGYANVRDFVPAMAGWQAAKEPIATDQVPARTFGGSKVDPALIGGVDAWLKGIPSDNYGIGTIAQLKELQAGGRVMVVDVREPSEFMAGHIPGAVNIPIRDLAKNAAQLTKDKPIALYALENHRAGMSVTVLQMLGYANARIFGSGFSGWQAAGEATEIPEKPC